jgi:hypothetical protein
MPKHCYKCLGIGWVGENHPSLPWSDELGCTCGAGMPCECNKAGEAGVDESDVSRVLSDAKENHATIWSREGVVRE